MTLFVGDLFFITKTSLPTRIRTQARSTWERQSSKRTCPTSTGSGSAPTSKLRMSRLQPEGSRLRPMLTWIKTKQPRIWTWLDCLDLMDWMDLVALNVCTAQLRLTRGSQNVRKLQSFKNEVICWTCFRIHLQLVSAKASKLLWLWIACTTHEAQYCLNHICIGCECEPW